MSLNWREIDAVLAELELTGTKIQRVVQPNFHELLLETYGRKRRKRILVSLEANRTRIHETVVSAAGEIKLQRFCQFLRSRIVGGRITECEQLGAERIVHLRIEREVATHVYLRLWSGAGNVIATDEDGTILDSFYRRPKRGEVSGETLDLEAILSRSAGRPSKKFEIRQFNDGGDGGGGDDGGPRGDRNGDTDGVPGGDGDKDGVPGGDRDGDKDGAGTLSERIERHYAAAKERQELESTTNRLVSRNERELGKAESALERLDRAISEIGDGANERKIGDLITANLHRIRTGDRTVTVDDYERPGSAMVIALEPSATGAETAARHYATYKSAKRRSEQLAKDRKALVARIAELVQTGKRLLSTPTMEELRRIERKGGSSRERSRVKEGPGLRFVSGAHEIVVGRSARENDELLRSYARGNDLWLHTRDVPGGHVFVRAIPGKSVPLDALVDAGNIAVFYSRAKSAGQADLYYTQVKHLKRPKGGSPGLVLPTREKNLFVRLDETRLKRLFDSRE